MLLLGSNTASNNVSQGVSFIETIGKYRARLRIDSGLKHIGHFECAEEAHQAYMGAKEAHIKTKALEWKDRIARDVFDALMSRSLN